MTSPPPPLPLDALVGKRLKGQYLLLKKLGQGGMGAVFHAINETLKKPLAVKVLLFDVSQGLERPQAEARFRREIELAGQMAQANIAQVFDCGVEHGYPFMVMEYVEGPDLSEVLQHEAPLPPARALEIINQIALALGEAERCGVVHRDIKPQNIKLQRYGAGGDINVKVLDFGIAKNVRDRQDELTQPGTIMGTPAYMAPEQCRGSPYQAPSAGTPRQDGGTDSRRGGIDGRADLYSTGVILYQMLTGHLPFTGDMMAMIGGHLFHQPPLLPASVPEPVRVLCDRLLRKSPDERYQTAKEFLDAIRGCQARLVPASVAPPMPSILPWVVSFTLLLALVGAAWLIVQSRRPPIPVPPDLRTMDLAHPNDLRRLEDLSSPQDLRPVDLAKPKPIKPIKPLPGHEQGRPPELAPVPPSRPPKPGPEECKPPMFYDSTGRCAI